MSITCEQMFIALSNGAASGIIDRQAGLKRTVRLFYSVRLYPASFTRFYARRYSAALALKGNAMKPYKTLLREADDEYLIQKSRFIGQAVPVQTPEAAIAFLESVRLMHRTANHHCYAYIIGQNAGIMRYSDDGEPGGTAGMPILEVMKARGVVDCAVVVTRYFGGVLLGAGGLTRAYSHTCALALGAAGVCEMFPTQRWLYEVEYPLWDKVQHTLKALPVKLMKTEFTATVHWELLCRTRDAQAVTDALTQITDGRVESLMTEETYLAWEEQAPLEG